MYPTASRMYEHSALSCFGLNFISSRVNCSNFIISELGLSLRGLRLHIVLGQGCGCCRLNLEFKFYMLFRVRAAERAGALMRLFDADGDGYLSFDEFRGTYDA